MRDFSPEYDRFVRRRHHALKDGESGDLARLFESQVRDTRMSEIRKEQNHRVRHGSDRTDRYHNVGAQPIDL